MAISCVWQSLGKLRSISKNWSFFACSFLLAWHDLIFPILFVEPQNLAALVLFRMASFRIF